MLKGFCQIAAVTTAAVLWSMTPSLGEVMEAETAEECTTQAGEATHFLFNGRCYITDESAEVVQREDVSTEGMCYNRCETDSSCGAPLWDASLTPPVCFHYSQK